MTKKGRSTPSVVAAGDTNPSDATVFNLSRRMMTKHGITISVNSGEGRELTKIHIGTWHFFFPFPFLTTPIRDEPTLGIPMNPMGIHMGPIEIP